MKGRKPFGSRLNRAFMALVAAFGIGTGGLVLDNLPKNPASDTQEVTTYRAGLEMKGFNISPSDQFWKHTLGMKSDAQKSAEVLAAAQSGDSWRMQALFEHGATANSEAAVSALSIASLKGDMDVVNVLLKNGVDPAANDGQALIAAVRANNTSLAMRYLDLGVPAGAQNGAALVYAAAENNEYLVLTLLGQDVPADAQHDKPLVYASLLGNTGVVQTLLNHGADAKANESLALRAASEAGNTAVMAQLIDAGADAGARNSEALILAAASGNSEAVKLVLNQTKMVLPYRDAQVSPVKAADVNAQDGLALELAVVEGNENMARLLIENGAIPHIKNGLPLALAVVQGDMPMAQLLLEKGADVNAGEGAALYTAVTLNKHGMAQLLIDKGANPDLRAGKIRQAAGDALMQNILEAGKTSAPDNISPGPRAPEF